MILREVYTNLNFELKVDLILLNLIEFKKKIFSHVYLSI